MLVLFEQGDFDIFEIRDNHIYILNQPKGNEHEGLVTSIDIMGNHAVTCGKDQLLKVWQLVPKKLLKEIHFPRSIQSAVFSNERLDLIVGYENLVSEITRANYMPNRIDVNPEVSIDVQMCSEKASMGTEKPESVHETLLKRGIKVPDEVPKPHTSSNGKVRIKVKFQEKAKSPAEAERKPPVFKQSAQQLAVHFK